MPNVLGVNAVVKPGSVFAVMSLVPRLAMFTVQPTLLLDQLKVGQDVNGAKQMDFAFVVVSLLSRIIQPSTVLSVTLNNSEAKSVTMILSKTGFIMRMVVIVVSVLVDVVLHSQSS